MKKIFILLWLVSTGWITVLAQCPAVPYGPNNATAFSQECASTVTLRALTSNPSCGTMTHRWYTQETGGTYVSGTYEAYGTCAVYQTKMTVSAAIEYWVSSYANGCESSRRKLTAFFTTYNTPYAKVSPSLTSVNGKYTGAVYCTSTGSATVTLTASGGGPGSSYQWYSAASGGSPIATTDVFTQTITYASVAGTSGIKTYYLGGYLINNTNCIINISPRKEVKVKLLQYTNTVNAGIDRTFFASDPVFTLAPNTAGNVWSSPDPGISGMTFDPAIAGAGVHPVNLVYQNSYSDTDVKCTTSSDQALYTVYGITAGGSGCLTRGSSISLTLTGTGYTGYAWTGPDGPISGSTNSITISKPGNYLVTATTSGAPKTFLKTIKLCSEAQTDINYVKIATPRVGSTLPGASETFFDGSPVSDITENFTYFDGLGRSVQKVVVQASPAKKDLVYPIVYDGFGRQSREYQPVVLPTHASGVYKAGILDAAGNYTGPALNFYNNLTDNIADDAMPYVESHFETGPLNRLTKKGGPGIAWKPMVQPSSYTNYSASYSYNDFTETPTTGGGGVNVSIANNVLTVSFSAGFTARKLKTGFVKLMPTSPLVYDMELGLICSGNYRVSVKDGYLYFESIPAVPATVTGFSQTFTVDLTGYAGDHSVRTDRLFNGANEVLDWTYTYATGAVEAGSTSSPVYYAVNKLYVEKVFDEHGKITLTYKDTEDRIILQRMQVGAAATPVNDNTYASTYYIYDDFGNLVCVIPPQASALLATQYFQSGATPTTKNDFLNRWAFRYTYDAKGRMSVKQIPGNAPIYLVYDQRDRLVLTQDGNQRAGATKYWTFTKYDQFNRPVMTGIKDTTLNLLPAAMQGAVDAHYAKPWARYYETYIGGVAGNIHGYNNKSYPVVTVGTSVDPNTYLTVNYYDSYVFRNMWTGYEYLNDTLSHTVDGATYSQPTTEHTALKGLITGTKIKVLDGRTDAATWLKSITYFDAFYHPVQVIRDHHKQGTERTTTVYDFSGTPIKTKITQIEADVAWKDVTTGVVQTGDRLFRSLGGSDHTQGAASTTMLGAGKNGWLEFTHSNANTLYIGLSDVNVDNNPTTIDYGIRVGGSSSYAVFTGTSTPVTIGTHAIGDVFRFERNSGTVQLKRNGVVEHTFSGTSTTALLVDISFNAGQSSVVLARASFSTSGHRIFRTFEYDHAGRMINAWHAIDNKPAVLLVHNVYNELGQLVDKKLHSTLSDGSDARQSVDYRYNIRGWLTGLNDAALSDITETRRDLFGLDLLYNDTDGLTNTATFNGNISAIKWSNNQGLGSVKQNAFVYTYDPMNRLVSSLYKEKATTWTASANNGSMETGITYDLNGNLKSLQRNDKRTTGWMDNLTYDYGSGTLLSNKLLSVTDAGDAANGFKDGNVAGNDYTYDQNGNMTYDLNRGISTAIAYNYLDLPEFVTRGGNSIKYVYDATGKKLAQFTNHGGTIRQTDYIGEYQYENDQLQHINHEEGRVVLVTSQTTSLHTGESMTGITSFNATLAAVTLNGSEKYIRATSNGTTARTGMQTIGNSVPVIAGQTFRIRSKGYSTGANPVYLQVKVNGTDVSWPGVTLPNSATTEAWVEQVVTVPTTGTMESGLVWNTVTSGQQFFLNEFEITLIGTSNPEYQYHLKDHLGNVRMTFTTLEQTESATATMETANQAEGAAFLYYDEAVKVNATVFDKTNVGPTYYATRLTGSGTERFGLAKSVSVMPGDVVRARVFAKYLDTNSSNWTPALANFMAAIAGGTAPAGTVVDGGFTGSIGNATPPFATVLNKDEETGVAPKAYLNFLVFNQDFTTLLDAGFVRVTTNAREYGQDGAHEELFKELTITQPGFVYFYLSNDTYTLGGPLVEVYFDDFTVEHVKSPVIQQDDYYPFGLNLNSWRRESTHHNDYLYNGKEKQDELGLDWLDYGARMYMPEIGRFGSTDDLANRFCPLSPYSYSRNNPISFLDSQGKNPVIGIYLIYEGVVYLFAAGTAMYIVSTTDIQAPTLTFSLGSAMLEARSKARDPYWARFVWRNNIADDLDFGQPSGNNMEPDPKPGSSKRLMYAAAGLLGLKLLAEYRQFVDQINTERQNVRKANRAVNKEIDVIYKRLDELDPEDPANDDDFARLAKQKKMLEALRNEHEQYEELLDQLEEYLSVQKNKYIHKQDAVRRESDKFYSKEFLEWYYRPRYQMYDGMSREK